MPYQFDDLRRSLPALAGALPPADIARELREVRRGVERIGVLTEAHIDLAVRHLSAEEQGRLQAIRHHQGSFLEHQTMLGEFCSLVALGHDRALAKIDLLEKRRPALQSEPQRITLEDLVVLAKVSKFDWDMRQLGFSSDAQLLEHYRSEGADIENILDGRANHDASVARMVELVGAERVKTYWDWSQGQIPAAKLVVMLGGDDTFKAGSQYVRDSYVLGINSDVFHSVGAHLRLDVNHMLAVLTALERGNFQIEEWTRLEVRVNGGEPVLALDELFIGELEARFTARSTIEQRAQLIRTKGSGVLIATGSGSTGWLRAATHSAYSGKNVWPRTARHAEFAVREPYGILETAPENGELLPGEELVIRSSHNRNGIISPDCVRDFRFPRGNVATVRLGQPLKVLNFRPSDSGGGP